MPGAVVLALVFTGVTGLRGVIGTAGLGRQAFSLASEFDFGFEQGHIAGHLARGQRYSVSFGDSAPMPTAWASPLYPVLLAGVFRWLGTYSYESAIAVIWLNAICHGGIAVLLLMTGRRIDSFGGAKAGWIAVLLFVAMPMGWQFLQWAWCVPTNW